MKISSRTINANGIRQHYLEAGDGPGVVLLHGFPETSYAWRFQIPELAKKYRVIAPDLRGYGETDKPSSGYDKRTMATHLRELMRALNLPKIALVGHDRGARGSLLGPAPCVLIELLPPARRGHFDSRQSRPGSDLRAASVGFDDTSRPSCRRIFIPAKSDSPRKGGQRGRNRDTLEPQRSRHSQIDIPSNTGYRT